MANSIVIGGSTLWVLAMIVLVVVLVPFGAIGYAIATRRSRQSALLFCVRFAVSFFVLLFLEYGILVLFPSFHANVCSFTARLTGWELGLVGVTHSVSGSTVSLQNPSLLFDVNPSCLGGLLLWTYTALVIAENSVSNRQRLAGILIGIAVLFVFDLFRIWISIYLEWLGGVTVHDYFYMLNMVVVLLVWIVWLRTLKPRTTRSANSLT